MMDSATITLKYSEYLEQIKRKDDEAIKDAFCRGRNVAAFNLAYVLKNCENKDIKELLDNLKSILSLGSQPCPEEVVTELMEFATDYRSYKFGLKNGLHK